MTDEAFRVAMLTPLPPARTGVAHYASMLLPALRQQVDLTPFASMDGYRRSDFDAVIYQLGNNPHHEWIYREAMREPGVVVLHDLVLHHLIVELTLARGDVDGYVAALEASHGAAGAAWARGRAAGLHSEMGNFLLPAAVDLARRSRAVIVHNEWAAGRLRSFGVATPVHVVPHPHDESIAATPPRKGGSRVIGLFGFLTSAKRADIVLAAFAEARRLMPALRLLVVGEPAPDIDVAQLASDGITFTGYADDEAFARYYGEVDRLVNLRYPTAGESSGTLIRAFQAGLPVAVSDYAQFAELPDDCVVKVPFGDGEVAALVRFFVDELRDPSAAQRDWLATHASMEQTVAGYRRALRDDSRTDGKPIMRSVPLFPQLALVAATAHTITIRNDGDAILRAGVYGEPAYRIIVKGFDGDTQLFDRWLALPRDLAPGDEATLELPPFARANSLRLYHAIESVPMLEPEAFARAAV
ncbi:MAG: glycosyl transferase, group 1 [Acidobacteria bacterium]|nr:glycosyl transferase, group 1 [Acidobacteriota bacterium]